VKLQINEALSYPPRFIKHVAANTPIIANKNSKPSVGIGEGERTGEGRLKAYFFLLKKTFICII
jgi:hypothetical protein